jgi:hypothetical protein
VRSDDSGGVGRRFCVGVFGKIRDLRPRIFHESWDASSAWSGLIGRGVGVLRFELFSLRCARMNQNEGAGGVLFRVTRRMRSQFVSN